ncbi:MAG: hypothetical protein L6R28_06625 [Planctomycetes bacterium]|nr:hypothetical protein [Planctomycetota bacterium]
MASTERFEMLMQEGAEALKDCCFGMAVHRFEEAAVCAARLKNPTLFGDAVYEVAKVRFNEGRQLEAADLWRRALLVYERIRPAPLLKLASCYKNLETCWTLQGDNRKAEKHRARWHLLMEKASGGDKSTP